MKITVTQAHIDESNQLLKDHDMSYEMYCPIALAYGNNCEVRGTNIRDGTTREIYELSRAARRFIKRFDKGKTVKPFTFVLTPR